MATFGNENRKQEFLLVKKEEFLMLKFGQKIKNNNVGAPEKIYKELHTQQPKLLTMWN